MIKLSFVIPCLNSALTLRATLEGIFHSHIPSEEREVIVVDNGSNDETVEIAKSFNATVVFCPTKGAGSARNFGAAHANGEFLAFIDSDTVVDPEWAPRLLEKIQSGYYSAALGRVIPDGPPGFLTSYRQNLARRRYSGTNISLYHFDGMSPVINTAACMVRASVFRIIGGFDERLKRYEDTEFSFRLFNNSGVIIATPEAVSRVYNAFGISAYLKRSFQLGKWKRNFSLLVHQDTWHSFRGLTREFFTDSLSVFSAPQLVFYYLNYFSVLTGFLTSLGTPALLSEVEKRRQGGKIRSLFTMMSEGMIFTLSGCSRLIVVDDRYYFFSTRTGLWQDFQSHQVDWKKLQDEELVHPGAE